MKAQSAIEYITSYSWAILIIIIVMAVIYFSGILNPKIPTICTSSTGYECSNLTIGTSGFVSVTFASPLRNQNISYIGCSSNPNPPSSWTYVGVSLSTIDKINLQFICPDGVTYIGGIQKGALWISYNTSGNNQHLINFAQISGTASFFPPIGWTSTTPYPINYTVDSCVESGAYIYCTGGLRYNVSIGSWQYTNASFFAPLSIGGIGKWISTTSFPLPMFFAGDIPTDCVSSNSYIYCPGAYSWQSYYAPLSSSGIGQWKSTSTYAMSATTGSSICTAYDSYIYCIGSAYDSSSPSGFKNITEFAPLSTSGIGTWETTNAPSYSGYLLLFGATSCDTTNSKIFCQEGLAGGPPDAQSAQISSSGIGSWTQSPYNQYYNYYSGPCLTSQSGLYCINAITSVGTGGYSILSQSGSFTGNWFQFTGNSISTLYMTPSCVKYGGMFFCVSRGSDGEIISAPLNGTEYTLVSSLSGSQLS
ncbi:hypothetical protein M1394_02335 [Candidatus Marsarchaeota archaeon]|nr:hypothetical protein [Candidatus Marsarchaeota archaeon]